MSKYTGGRIVPRHDGEWDSTKEYERLTIVLNPDDGVSYIARKSVPAGTELSDTEYWAVCSQFSGQLDSYQKQVDADLAAAEAKMQDNREAMDDAVKTLTARLDANVTASTDGDADYAAEVVDARVDADGLAFDSLGDAVRTANSALDMAIPVTGVSSYRSSWNSESGGVKASLLSVNGSGRGMEVVFSVGLDEDSLYGYSYGQMKISSANYTSYLEGKIVDILILSDSEEAFPLVLAYGWSAFNYSNVESGLILYKSVMIRKGSNVIRLNMGSDECVQMAEANAALDSPSSTFYIFAEIGTLGLAGFAKDCAGLDATIRVYCCVNREENMDGTGMYSKFSSVDDVWEVQQRDLKEKYHSRYNFADESYVSAFIINEDLESSGYGSVTVEGNRVSVNKECRTSDGYNAYVCIAYDKLVINAIMERITLW
ncbi:MAG: hypothetical protein LIP11_07665 [Clostridiales bacterium]|nr:hypothetical protein [Clostridiales bacterium]